MPYSNEELLAMLDSAIKGITVTNTLGNTILEPQQFDRYVRQLQNKTVLLPQCRLQVMESHVVDIDRIAFSSRIFGPPATEGQSLSESDFVSPEFAQHQMTAQELQGIVSMTDKMLRRNPERQALMNTILDMMAERGGLDIEELGIKGDTLSADPFLALNEGWLKLTRRRVVEKTNEAYDDGAVPYFTTGAGETTKKVAWNNVPIKPSTFELWESPTGTGTKVAVDDGAGNITPVGSGVGGTIDYESGVVNLTGLTAVEDYGAVYTAESFDKTAAEFPENMFDLLVKVIPKSYYRTPAEWKINVPWYIIKAYRDRLKARYTSLGDEYQKNGGVSVPWEGLTVQYVPNMPINKPGWLMHPDNTMYGVFLEVQMEQEREAKKKRTDVIINTETDYAFEEPEATVVADL